MVPAIMTDRKNNDSLQKTASMIKQLASSLIAMISRIMQPEVTIELVRDVDRHIKIYLSTLTQIDDMNIDLSIAKVNKRSKKSNMVRKRKINTTSNLTTLLNIPGFMQQYGPPRLYWEGGYKGEGVLRLVKPVVTQGTHMTWFATAALQRYFNEKSMRLLLHNNDEISPSTKQLAIDNYSDRKLFTYRFGIQQIRSDITAGNPVSGALCRASGNIFCMVMIDKRKKMVSVNMADCDGTVLDYTYQTPISLIGSDIIDILPRDNLTFVMLLPNRNEYQKFGGSYYYYCITDDWKERMKDSNNTIIYGLPRINDVSY